MNSCNLGFHQWTLAYEGKVRVCKKCRKRQEKNPAGKWVESQAVKSAPEDKTKYCECPRDYTVALKIQLCPRCGLPRRPRVLPSR